MIHYAKQQLTFSQLKTKTTSWMLLIVFFLASAFLHLEVSNFLTSPNSTPFGKIILINYQLIFAWLMGGFLFAYIIFQAYKGTRHTVTLCYWAV